MRERQVKDCEPPAESQGLPEAGQQHHHQQLSAEPAGVLHMVGGERLYPQVTHAEGEGHPPGASAEGVSGGRRGHAAPEEHGQGVLLGVPRHAGDDADA